MKELIILITMFFAEPNTYPNALRIAALHGEPLRFASEQECANHINENFDAMTMYPNAVTVKSMFCVEKENGFTGV